ncbi:methionyl-tRNA formyltransferase [Psychroflexus sp. ALD_RP9]|uniref:methionyl-tRNA formyltransferase n=1 Tax=Psychroflexus sp. ALD_RP9 TaxID=2777186 RepID=UPI001A8DC479|nr:methionyl-tRNA formyltransferase [Psychroflexus sp. ALD_RP9]QSS97323.1 methionyl-tRNA formyltransferase [Psychroflexus sp. ALD_RP9]
MRKLRILFMGTPDFAVKTLKSIHESFEVCGVVTAPDKPAGRGRKLNKSAVKVYAESIDLEILQPTNLKSEKFQNELKRLNPNLIVVVAFRMLPKSVWNFPKYGTFNIHASLLPEYRGAAPINWAIINGENKTGVTSFFIDDKIDTGEIIKQKEILISPDETAGSLHDKLMHLGAALAVETCKAIQEEQVVTTKQPKLSPKEAPKLTKENTQINWNNSSKSIINLVKGLNPYPMSWTTFNEDGSKKSVKIIELSNSDETIKANPGEVILSKKQILIKTKDDWVEIKKLKYPGKKALNIQDFLNGYSRPDQLKLSL